MVDGRFEHATDRDLLAMLASDTFRARGKAGVGVFAKLLLGDRAFRAITSYRVCRWARTLPAGLSSIAFFPAYVAHRLLTGAICADIPVSVAVGPGLAINHGYGLVINKGAVIGANATLFHQVTIGASARGIPSIGNDVVLAAQAIVIGAVRVGDGATVGAGSVVLKDVDSHTIVAGNPAKVIATGVPARTKNPVRSSYDPA